MKKLILLFIGFSFVWFVNAQEADKPEVQENDVTAEDIKTLFGGSKVDFGRFISLESNTGMLFDAQSLFVGLQGGWVANHWLSFGISGYGLVTNLHKDDIIDTSTIQIEIGYGGVFVEPAIAPKFPVHISFPISFGLGYSIYRDEFGYYDDYLDEWEKHRLDDDMFVYVEPGVMLEFNVVKFFRLGFNLKYRYISDLDLPKTEAEDLSGLSGGIVLKFGKF